MPDHYTKTKLLDPCVLIRNNVVVSRAAYAKHMPTMRMEGLQAEICIACYICGLTFIQYNNSIINY